MRKQSRKKTNELYRGKKTSAMQIGKHSVGQHGEVRRGASDGTASLFGERRTPTPRRSARERERSVRMERREITPREWRDNVRDEDTRRWSDEEEAAVKRRETPAQPLRDIDGSEIPRWSSQCADSVAACSPRPEGFAAKRCRASHSRDGSHRRAVIPPFLQTCTRNPAPLRSAHILPVSTTARERCPRLRERGRPSRPPATTPLRHSSPERERDRVKEKERDRKRKGEGGRERERCRRRRLRESVAFFHRGNGGVRSGIVLLTSRRCTWRARHAVLRRERQIDR